MQIRKYVRQVRPIQENYIKPDVKIQTLLSEADTGFATLMEKAIVMGYNINQGMSEEEAAKKGNITLSDWEKEKKSLGDSGVKNGMDIAKKLSVDKLSTAAQSHKPTTNSACTCRIKTIRQSNVWHLL